MTSAQYVISFETKQPHSVSCVCYTLGVGRRKPIKGAKVYVVLPLDVVVLRPDTETNRISARPRQRSERRLYVTLRVKGRRKNIFSFVVFSYTLQYFRLPGFSLPCYQYAKFCGIPVHPV